MHLQAETCRGVYLNRATGSQSTAVRRWPKKGWDSDTFNHPPTCWLQGRRDLRYLYRFLHSVARQWPENGSRAWEWIVANRK